MCTDEVFESPRFLGKTFEKLKICLLSTAKFGVVRDFLTWTAWTAWTSSIVFVKSTVLLYESFFNFAVIGVTISLNGADGALRTCDL